MKHLTTKQTIKTLLDLQREWNQIQKEMEMKTLLTKEEMQELTQQLVLIARQLDDGLITTEAAETRIAEMLNIKIGKETK